MRNKWVDHVMNYMHEHNVSYGDALKLAKATYRPAMMGGSLTADETRKFIKAGYDKKKNKDLDGYQVDKSLSGKRTKVYFNPETNKSVIVHRGTDSIQDVGTDAALMLGYRGKRFEHAKKMQRKAEKKYGTENMHTLGHSLGGLVAEEVGGKSRNVITLNKAISPWEISRKNDENQTDIRTRNDPVSMLNKYSDNRAHLIDSKSANPLAEHSSDTLSRVNPNVVFGSGIENRRRYRR